MARLTREELYKKYHETLKAMYEASGKNDDTSVCMDKLIYTYRVKKGIITKENPDVYPGIPENFDWEEFGKDYAGLMEE